jgi:hypothetical protein
MAALQGTWDGSTGVTACAVAQWAGKLVEPSFEELQTQQAV